ncbi:MAG: FecR family protein [Bacteroidales bacterium]|nr:FecR family protein [Bacteroidales bacterium]MBN2633379.1 FecR family protein [Bacteroidales bacterium]
MKEKTDKEELIDRELKELAPQLSDDTQIDVDRAWNRVLSQINETVSETDIKHPQSLLPRITLKIAAAILVLASLGTAALLIRNNGSLMKTVVAASDDLQNTTKITLPDGSLVSLHGNTRLTYNPNFGKKIRKVSLSGEAFFEITSDASCPFIIDAGMASVKVIGTSFNVITKNPDSAVEVFVQSGKVMLSDNSGKNDIVLEPGFIGILDSEHSDKTLNENPNYMAWNTGKLMYDGQTLDLVFRDMKRVFDMDIAVDDPSILDNKWTSAINIESRDTIIRLICTSFNLSYIKDGDVYRLSKR